MNNTEKLAMRTPSLADENYATLAALFPNAVTETVDDNGTVVRAIDKDVLAQEINVHVVEGREERYQFTWPDKRKSIILANAPIAASLRPCHEESVDFDTTENLYIEGDNLDVLKLLRETYLNRVKMIYIDPPYNTGNDFVYVDDFSENTDAFFVRDGQYDEEGNRLVKNLDSNGRFHTDWLNMIYPRLRIAHDLLSDDGVIFISIDDNEIENIKKICIEIFGEANFVTNMIWQSRTSISNDHEVSMNHNHTLVFSKNRNNLDFGGDIIDIADYINPDNDLNGPWKLVPIDANHIGGNTVYAIQNPKTGVDYYPPNGRIWSYNEQTLKRLMVEGRIKFGLNDDSAPKRKLYYNERIAKGDKKTPSSLILDAGTTKDGTIAIMQLFENKKIFDYPKSVEFIKRLVLYGTYKGSGIILDFFSGSATTAHAVMQLNAEDCGKRKYIMVQLPEVTPDGSPAREEGYENICEIGKERIRRAGKKIKEKIGLATQDLDIGFRVFKLDSSNMKDVYYTPEEFLTVAHKQQNLFDFMDNIKEERSDEDLLFQVMLDLGIPLSAKITQNSDVFSVNENYLIACFKQVDTALITNIAKSKPYYAVFRDSSFINDSAMVNFEQIFNTYSPNTIRRVL